MNKREDSIRDFFKKNAESVISVSDYYGNEKYEFIHNKIVYIFVIPKNPKNDEWIYRTEFFGAFDYADAKMVNDGYYLATAVISDLYGAPEAIALMDEFYRFMTYEFSLNKRTILFGFSRGGLYATNFAIVYPERIKSIYLDAPVIDIASWPGGEGKGTCYTDEYADCKRLLHIENSYDMKQYQLELDRKLTHLAELKIPIIIVYGDADEVVVFEENSLRLIEKLEKAGGSFKVIRKPDIGHHPHSLENPSEIVSFLEEN
ncbi:MAG: prolyl oligopeptidase family serine peptidase [Clostridia bacterium]